QEKKIFAVQGHCPIIRRLLRARGWVERKLPGTGRVGGRPEQRPGSQEWRLLEEEEEEGSDGAEHGEASCLARDQVPYFIWTSRCGAIDGWLLRQDQVLNHYSRVGAFTTKEGLCLNLRNLPWFDQADPDTFFPRCYRLGDADERQAFIEDFCLTAARSLIKVALERAGDTPPGTEQPPKSGEGLGECGELGMSHVPHPMPPTTGQGPPLSPQLVEEALQLCEQHLGSLGHQDIDGDPLAPRMSSTDWDRFLRDYYCLVHEGSVLALSGAQRERGRALLRQLGGRLPQFAMEGDRNVWILKPGAKSRGRGKAGGRGGRGVFGEAWGGSHTHYIPTGIVCSARLEEVLQLAGGCAGPSAPAGGWVVQKYVERPLLIYGTKFDVRQWFLVTDWNPLTVWFYRESYVRFCSQPFSLRHLDPARHLCNVSIQKWCRPARDRDPRLPPDHIWSCRQLQAYLARAGRGGAWHQVMVPGMKAAVVGALRSAQDLVGSRKGSFELYGADFVFGEDCQPWLLEINASPTMAPSSAVTRRLCASVQRDTLRVVIDRRADPTCPTGAFELIYKE
ncbi:TTLL3 monoglycylase, partial [Syrrhaptes paradoxus]|nr:TTLL3 monoglycylase [Syrrhaptes paradoxus]